MSLAGTFGSRCAAYWPPGSGCMFHCAEAPAPMPSSHRSLRSSCRDFAGPPRPGQPVVKVIKALLRNINTERACCGARRAAHGRSSPTVLGGSCLKDGPATGPRRRLRSSSAAACRHENGLASGGVRWHRIIDVIEPGRRGPAQGLPCFTLAPTTPRWRPGSPGVTWSRRSSWHRA